MQGKHIRRAISYWLACMLVVANMAVCWLVLPRNPSSFGEFAAITYELRGPILLTSLLVLPLIIIDLVRVSSRFAEPVYRLRHEIKRIADGQEATPLQFRKRDDWQELANDFNRMLERLQYDGRCQRVENRECISPDAPSADTDQHAIVS